MEEEEVGSCPQLKESAGQRGPMERERRDGKDTAERRRRRKRKRNKEEEARCCFKKNSDRH